MLHSVHNDDRESLFKTMMKHKDTGNSAFTLVELLSVIAIIAFLVAISSPVINSVMARSKEAKCVSNLRRLGAAVLVYAADHNGFILPRFYVNNADPAYKPDNANDCWNAHLIGRGYLAVSDAFYCPSYAPFNSRAEGVNDLSKGMGQCYGMRDWRTKNGGIDEYNLPKKLNAIETPSDFFLLGDSYWKSWGTQGYSIVPGASDKNSFVHFRHTNGTANLFFADGSVRSIARSYITEINKTQLPYGRSGGFLSWPVVN